LLKKKNSDSTKKFSEIDIINMLESLIDNVFLMFLGRVLQQTVGIPMGTNCAPFLVDVFLYSYETNFVQGRIVLNRPLLSISRCSSRYEADLSISVVSYISSSMGLSSFMTYHHVCN
jgi:hypothetical protein